MQPGGEPSVALAVASASRGESRSVHLTRTQEALLVLGAWIATAAWVWFRLDQGWVPHDDGAFAQSATRVLAGQLPHREFAELYTGGMTFLNAAAMSVFGEDLISLRYPLFAAFLCFLPAAYYVARTFANPITALLAAIAAVTWSVPVYPAAMASWYLLVFSVCGTACLVRWRSTHADRWLLACGVLAGVSLCFKIVAVYFLAAVVLFLLFVHPNAGRRRAWPLKLAPVSIGGIALAAGLVVSVLGGRYGAPEVLNFLAPIAAVSVALLVQRSQAWRPHDARRGSLLRDLGILGAGVVIPVVTLTIPYVVAGATGDLLEGTFVSPQSRRDVAYLATPTAGIVPAACVVGVLLLGARLSQLSRRRLECAVAALVLVTVVLAGFLSAGYTLSFAAIRGLAPIAVIVGSVALVRGRWGLEERRSELVFLILAVVAFTSLVQFPFGAAVYFCYVAPLVVLATAALIGTAARPGFLAVSAMVAFTLFGASYLDRMSLYDLHVGERFVRDGQVEVLDEDRASIRVYPSQAASTREVVRLLRQHSVGRYTFAGPDLPQIYFLADLENPTRSLFDFLDLSHSARGGKLLETLRRKEVTAIAVHQVIQLSPPLDAETLEALRATYPNHKRVDVIDVRWRSP
jgi:Dolichyl-phosphate-mannose-protein mannosyltransferase